jgi:hypothetical protein
MVTGNANPLMDKPVVEGVFSTSSPDRELINLGNNRILTWEAALGNFQIQEYEMMAVGTLSLEDVAEKLKEKEITGSTIITHGWQLSNDGGDSLEDLAKAIFSRAGGWYVDYDIDVDDEIGYFDPLEVSEGGEVVLLFDWAPESNEISSGWGESAGDALFSIIVGLNIVDPETPQTKPLHFIGHSFGTAVTSEAVERLAYFDIQVDHITYLDPHDFDQGILPVDGAQRLFDLGMPVKYGASVWETVNFADVYYQTDIAPDGRPIPGAYNELLNDLMPNLVAPHIYLELFLPWNRNWRESRGLYKSSNFSRLFTDRLCL